MSPKHIRFAAALLLVCLSCNSDPLDVDISNIKVELEFHRMERELFSLETADMSSLNVDLLAKYGEFYELYLQEIVGIGSPYDPMVALNLKRFTTDLDMKDVAREIEKTFSDLSALEAELNKSFRYYKYYFPEHSLPKIVTYHSGFNYGAYCTDSVLGIGLEMYLGRNNQLVQALPNQVFPAYIKQKMDPEYLLADAMIGWLNTHHFGDSDNLTFLETIVEMGKNLYVLSAVLPQVPDHVKIHYEKEQWDWCLDNETNIWREIVEQELLFSKDQNKIMKFVTPGPFTTGLPHESPSRVGTWLGWRMVNTYMAEKSGITISQLLAEKDAAKILKYYKPER